jgi:beta-glucosidase
VGYLNEVGKGEIRVSDAEIPVQRTVSSFSRDFVWGTAMSAYQIEGSVTTDGRGRSIWDDFCDVDGAIRDASSGMDACRHYEMWRDDIDLMKSLNLDAYRLSIAWPRVVPDGDGDVNMAGLDFYDRLVDGLLEAGIEPFVTLYHWDLPVALESKGGWLNRDTSDAFARYTRAVVGRLGDRVGHWMTLNEPYVSANLGYVTGQHAPGRHLSQAKGFDAAHHLMIAHALGTAAIREEAPSVAVGIALNFTPVTQVGSGEADRHAASVQDAIHNRWFLEPLAGLPYPEVASLAAHWDAAVVLDGDMEAIRSPLDFLGINYYTRQLVDRSGVLPAPEPTTTMDWEIRPEELTSLLGWVHSVIAARDYFITENGAAMPDDVLAGGIVQDTDRIRYLADHIDAVAHAIASGIPVGGYFVWSLLDNFEWSLGYEQKFGLVAVEPGTYRRIPKASASWYREMIAGVRAGFDQCRPANGTNG